jgi:predicted small lipoprotein YifL
MVWCAGLSAAGPRGRLLGVAPVNRRFLSHAVLVGLLAAAVGLSGCGRKGALEAPSGAAVKTATAGEPPPADTAPNKPDKHFVLDPLLK